MPPNMRNPAGEGRVVARSLGGWTRNGDSPSRDGKQARRRRADDALAAHAALLRAELADPTLRANPCWTVLRQDAFEQWAKAFEDVDA